MCELSSDFSYTSSGLIILCGEFYVAQHTKLFLNYLCFAENKYCVAMNMNYVWFNYIIEQQQIENWCYLDVISMGYAVVIDYVDAMNY